MQIEISVIDLPEMSKKSSKFSILRTYVVRCCLTLKFYLEAKIFK